MTGHSLFDGLYRVMRSPMGCLGERSDARKFSQAAIRFQHPMMCTTEVLTFRRGG